MFLLSEMAICVSIFMIFDALSNNSVKIGDEWLKPLMESFCHPLFIYVVLMRLFANTLNHLLLIHHSILKASSNIH